MRILPQIQKALSGEFFIWAPDLSGVVEALAQEHGLQTRRIATIADHEKLYYSTDYILVTNNQSFLETHADQLRAGVHGPGPIVLWTDHFSNIFRILKN